MPGYKVDKLFSALPETMIVAYSGKPGSTEMNAPAHSFSALP